MILTKLKWFGFFALLLFFGILFSTLSVQAATYHVDYDNGSDTNNGSASTPWKTPWYAGTRVVPGDTVIVHARAGGAVYTSGTTAAAIQATVANTTWKAAPGEVVWISSTNNHSSNVYNTCGFCKTISIGAANVTIDGFYVWGNIHVGAGGDNSIIQNNDLSGGGDYQGFPAVIRTTGNPPNTTPTDWMENLLVRNNKIHDNLPAMAQGSGNDVLILTYGTKGMILENNEFYDGLNTGIKWKDRGNQMTARYNFFHNMPQGIEGDTQVGIDWSDIYQNVFINNGTAVSVANGAPNYFYVRNNTFYNNIRDIGYWQSTSQASHFWNNIHYHATGGNFLGFDSSNWTISDFDYIDYNDYYSGAGNTSWWVNGSSKGTTLSAWKSFLAGAGCTTGINCDENSITTNPNFLNSSGTFNQPADFKRTSYPANGRSSQVMGAYQTGTECIGLLSTCSGTLPPPPPPPSDTTAPSVSTGLSATAISQSQINLSWTASTDNVGVTGYRIYRAGTQIATTANTTYSNTGLTASTAYSYTVAAYDAAGNVSAQSSSASATTQAPTADITPPVRSSGAPSGSLPSSTTQTTLSLSTNETATCKYSTTANTSYASIPNTFSTTNSTNHSVLITGLSSGSAYSYYIRCQDQSNNSNPDDYLISFSVALAGGSSQLPSNLIGYWNFDEGSGLIANDSSSNNSGTLTNGPTWTTGKVNGAINFDGVNDMVDLGSPTIMDNLDPFTITMWILPNTLGGSSSGRLFNKATLTTEYKRTKLQTPNTFSSFITRANGIASTVAASDSITLGAWQFAAITFSSADGIRFYTAPSGGSVSETAYTSRSIGSGAPTDDSASNFIIGAFTSGSQAFNGKIDEVMIYNRILSLQELSSVSNYTGSVIPPPPPSDTTAPSVPTNLSATAISSTQINLSWIASTDNVGVTGYRIYRGGTQIGTSNTTSYSDTGLSPSTSYSYTVSAYDAANNVSAQSVSASATTQAPPVSTTSNVSFNLSLERNTTINSNSFTISIYNPGSSTAIYTATQNPTANSITLSSITIAPSTYDVKVSSPYYLSKKQTNISLTNNSTITIPTLPAGDLNQDNVINSLDYSMLSSKWFLSDPISDINKDTIVNSIDFSIMNRNWLKIGE
ncbi:MAG: LamG-like jellyroll fold domain-containing protein [Patescibacteria group bacterium]